MSNWSPLSIPDSSKEPFTDYSRWRLRNTTDGSHIWDYLRSDEEAVAWSQADRDKYFLGLPLNYSPLPKAHSPLEAARNGYTFYKNLQSPDGHWAGEYGGPMFLLPGLVIGSYVSGMSFLEVERLEMVRYVLNHAHPEDGGWGLHIEGPSTVFGTAMNYVALRLLGVSAEHPAMIKARATLHKLGGAVRAPAWGKFWLSILNCYEWEGNNPVPTELLLLPKWLPLYPGNWWIHVRTVYVPMAYLSAVRFQAEENEIIRSLRQELYVQPYHSIDWPAQCNNVAPGDIYYPHSFIFDRLNDILKLYEPCSLPPLRRAGINEAYNLIVREDENTTYQTLGPVSKMMNLVARFHAEGPESHAYKMHDLKRKDFMWISGEGMMMCGTNGSQLWDVAFITQALVETGLAKEEENKDSLIAALKWLEQCQITENPKHFETSNRHRTKGAWPFSTKEQGYTVSDCTGEGLKSVLYLQNHLDFTPKVVSDRRIFDAVDTLLTMQNASGGFASYELIRGPSWLELLNAAEVFGNIMIEYAYPECTTSVITTLSIFRKSYPSYRSAEIAETVRRAINFLHNAQYPEGGWFGSWGICFTYATMFALESLSLVGETYETSKYAKKACDWLVSKQRADGGWGESWKTCETAQWTEHENTQVVQTCWATMALMYAKYPETAPIAKAVRLVMDRQLPDGSWAQEAIEGVFNKSCAISYPNFKFSFTVWMLGKAHKYLEERNALKLVTGASNGFINGAGGGVNGVNGH